MTKSKRITSIIAGIMAVLSVVLLGFALAGCGETVTTKEDETKVHSAVVTSWWQAQEDRKGLDTSVNINFDNLNIEDIDKITFEIYQDDEIIGSAVSEGENLTNLLKDCAQYWDETEETYLEVTGDRTISCAFFTLNEEENDDFWVRSACSIEEPEVPTNLIVKVLAGDTEYITELVK